MFFGSIAEKQTIVGEGDRLQHAMAGQQRFSLWQAVAFTTKFFKVGTGNRIKVARETLHILACHVFRNVYEISSSGADVHFISELTIRHLAFVLIERIVNEA